MILCKNCESADVSVREFSLLRFMLTKTCTDTDIFNAWRAVEKKLVNAAVAVVWHDETVLRYLSEELEGIVFYGRF